MLQKRRVNNMPKSIPSFVRLFMHHLGLFYSMPHALCLRLHSQISLLDRIVGHKVLGRIRQGHPAGFHDVSSMGHF